MLLNIIVATIFYFLIGFMFFRFLETRNGDKSIKLFVITYAVALYACLLYYLLWIHLGLTAHKGVQGLFSPDSSTYYLDAVSIANARFSSEALGRIITDHYHPVFLAVQIFIFGEHVLIPKIYQVLLFSMGVVLWTSIARDILKDPRIERYFFYLLLSCLPLLTYTAHVLKEMSLFLTTSVAIYGFVKFYYKKGRQYKYLWVSLLGILLMFMFRRQFALVMFFSLALGILVGSGLNQQRKMVWVTVSIIMFFVFSSLPVFQEIGATSPLTEGGRIFIARGEGYRVAATTDSETQGMVGGATFLIKNPTVAAPMFIYGVFQIFFHPPFLYTPAEMIARGNLSYLTMGYYNLFFALMLPAFYFGLKFIYKGNKSNPVLIALLIYFIFSSLGTIFGSDSYRRFKVSYFWPIAFLYISYGIAMFPLWKKKLPLVALVFVILLIAYFAVDLIGFVAA